MPTLTNAPVLAADLGGTWMRAALVAADGSLLTRARRPTPGASVDDFVALLAEIRSPGTASAVIGLPGRVDYRDGTLDFAPNLDSSWLPRLSAESLSTALGLPVALANDADLACVGECTFGAGRGEDDVVFVTLSTGVGGGVFAGGRLMHARKSLAEVGHIVLDRTAEAVGAPCTFEDLASGTALVRMAGLAGIGGDGASIVARALQGEPGPREVWERVVAAAVVGFRNLAFLYSPGRFVVGGGLGSVGEPLLGPIRADLAANGPRGLQISVVSAALADDAGLMGAAAWARVGPAARGGAATTPGR